MLDKAERRVAGMKSIHATLDLGNGLNVEKFDSMIEDMRSKLENYNTILSTIDKARNDILALEQQLGDYSEHMLMGVAVRYGKSSNEYQMAGGVRKSDRRKAQRGTSVESPVSEPATIAS